MISHNKIKFQGRGRWDNDINTASAVFSPGQWIKRDSLDDPIHHAGAQITKLDKPHLLENRFLNNFVSGSWRITWEKENFTDKEVVDFIENCPMEGWTTDITQTQIIRETSDANAAIPDWTEYRLKYQLKSTTATIEALTEGEMFCLSFLNSTYENYKVEAITLEESQNIKIQEPGSYIIPLSDSFLKEGQKLKKFRTYKLVSNTVELNNDSNNRVRLLKICGM